MNGSTGGGSWWNVTVSALGLVLLNGFINGLDEGMDVMAIRFRNDREPGRRANSSDNRIRDQNYLDRLEH